MSLRWNAAMDTSWASWAAMLEMMSAVTEVTVVGGMKGAADADGDVGGAAVAILAFFLAASEIMYCFMLFTGSSLANDLASFLQVHVLRRDMVPFLIYSFRLWS